MVGKVRASDHTRQLFHNGVLVEQCSLLASSKSNYSNMSRIPLPDTGEHQGTTSGYPSNKTNHGLSTYHKMLCRL